MRSTFALKKTPGLLSRQKVAGKARLVFNIRAVKPDFHPLRRNHTVSTLNEQFEQAVADSKNLPDRPDNMTLLKLYALYKQGSSGDADGKRPGFADMVGRAKWDAWNELKGQSADEAQQAYIDLIEDLK
jgi:acyl-CoA-binding protein